MIKIAGGKTKGPCNLPVKIGDKIPLKIIENTQ